MPTGPRSTVSHVIKLPAPGIPIAALPTPVTLNALNNRPIHKAPPKPRIIDNVVGILFNRASFTRSEKGTFFFLAISLAALSICVCVGLIPAN